MGSANSTTTFEEKTPEDLWWNPVNNRNKNKQENSSTNFQIVSNDANVERSERKKILDKELDEFKKDLHLKHEKRRQLIIERKQELSDIRVELQLQKMVNEELKEKLGGENSNATSFSYDKVQELLKENEEQKKIIEEMKLQIENFNEITEKNSELRVNIVELQKELQGVNEEMVNFETERNEYKTHVTALKDVIKVSKEMLNIRESQIQELKQKISVIESSLADREVPLLANDLRLEYERQLRNIRSLRALYEERERVDRREKQNMAALLEDTKKMLQTEQTKNEEHQTRIEELEKENSIKYDAVNNLESQLGLAKAECKELQAEMAVINQLFSQILLGFNNSQDIDLDKLIKTLEENHDLLSKIAINEESTVISAALPKTLLDLVNQMNEEKRENLETTSEKLPINFENKLETIIEETDSQTAGLQLSSAEEIVQNLPKVWRVLIELLSHQCVPSNTIIHEPSNKENEHLYYKSVQTPSGPKLVLSVSKTFIRLKDLILEKKSLEKETNHLKHLNTHLETRLQDQEKRLEMVSKELSKTWHVVGKMQKQHQQLHTQEKILRYELAQKRKLLNELKEELEYCREKWIQAREKNTTTEMQWKQLRKEFASRKPHVDASTESGYSDDKTSSDEKSSSDEELPYDSKKLNTEDDSKSTEHHNDNKSLIPEENEETVMSDVNDANTSSNNELDSNNSAQDNCILEVVKSAIANIEEAAVDSNIVDSTNDVNHSALNNEKTDLVQSKQRQNVDSSVPSTSNQSKINIEEMLARREERLTRMEQQGKELVTKVANTTKKSVDIFNKLGNLHEIYGENSRNDDSAVKPSTSSGSLESSSKNVATPAEETNPNETDKSNNT